jgi:hypothetical protein
MILKLLLASALSLAITPGAHAQRVELQAFGPANGDQIPFAIRVTGSVSGDESSRQAEFASLIDDFEALGSKIHLAQPDTKGKRGRGPTLRG